MMPLLGMYGDLQSDVSFTRPVDDVCTLVEKNPMSWSVKFDRSAIADLCENRSLPQIMRAVYLTKAQAKKASWWCCRSQSACGRRYVEAQGTGRIYCSIEK
jgi:hypothetical protein